MVYRTYRWIGLKTLTPREAKESRINARQAHLKAGRIYFLNTIQGLEELDKEFCEFPGGPHDDIPDAISMLQTCAPQTPTKAANSEAFNEIYKTLNESATWMTSLVKVAKDV